MTREIFLAVALLLSSSEKKPAETPVIDECTPFRQALSALPAAGGRVEVPAGTFTCRRPIVLDRDHVELVGQGPGSLLRLADGADCPLIVVGDAAGSPARRRHLRVSDLRVDGNRRGQSHECWGGPCDRPPRDSGRQLLRNNGITVRGAHDVVISRVVVFGARSAGLVSERGSRHVTIRDVVAYDNAFDGVAAYETELSLLTGLHLYDNGAAGLSFDRGFHRNLVSDVVLSGNGTVGIFLRDARANIFRGLQIHDSGEHGIFLADVGEGTPRPAIENSFIGCRVEGSGRLVSESEKGHGFRVNDRTCLGNRIEHCRFSANLGRCVSSSAPLVMKDVECVPRGRDLIPGSE